MRITPELDTKIEELFHYRMFPELLDESKASKYQKAELWIALKEIQAAIYHLDAELERGWELNNTVLQSKWEEIYMQLLKVGITGDKAKEYCSQIRKYQHHEVSLRVGKLPLKLKMGYFYFYKSCDVKLMRRIIFDTLPELKKLFSLADWRNFDLVTEVNDDVADLYEDLETINGNRFLIHVIKGGKQETKVAFTQFLEEIALLNIPNNYTGKEWSSRIISATEENILATKLLITENLNKFTNQDQARAQILPFII